MDYPYHVFDTAGRCLMHAPESCRYPRRVELDMLEAGYIIKLHGKKIQPEKRKRYQRVKGGAANENSFHP